MLSDLIFRLRTLFRCQKVEEELQEELQYHLEREAHKYSEAGVSADEARRPKRGWLSEARNRRGSNAERRAVQSCLTICSRICATGYAR